MLEAGKIIGIEANGMARVSMVACADCAHCGACRIMGEDARVLIARNEVNAQLGEKVQVEITTRSRINGALLLFLMPIITFFAGFIFAVQFFFFGEGLAALVGLGVSAIYFAVVAMFDKRRRRLGQVAATIVRVVSS